MHVSKAEQGAEVSLSWTKPLSDMSCQTLYFCSTIFIPSIRLETVIKLYQRPLGLIFTTFGMSSCLLSSERPGLDRTQLPIA